MEDNKGQSGAAVRGEAVALTDAQIGNFWMDRDCIEAIRAGDVIAQFVSAFRAGMKALGVSARAADAPSEPSELRHAILEVLMNRANGMSEDHLLFYRAAGDANRPVSMLVAELVAAVLSNRAADALDSQPTGSRIAELESQLAECVALSQKWASAAGEADGRALKAREAALDEAAGICMRATPDPDHVRRIGEAAHYVACSNAILRLKSASSQPTDGGVRNG